MTHDQSQTLIGIIAIAVILSPILGTLVWAFKSNKQNTTLKPQDVKPSEVPEFKDLPFTKHYYALEFMAPIKKFLSRDKASLGTLDVRDPSGNSIGKVFIAHEYRFSVESGGVAIECEYTFKKFTEILDYMQFFTMPDKKVIMSVASSVDFATGPFEFTLNDRTFKLSSISLSKKIFDIEENGQLIGRICCATWSRYLIAVFSKEMDDLAVSFIFGVYGRMGR